MQPLTKEEHGQKSEFTKHILSIYQESCHHFLTKEACKNKSMYVNNGNSSLYVHSFFHSTLNFCSFFNTLTPFIFLYFIINLAFPRLHISLPTPFFALLSFGKLGVVLKLVSIGMARDKEIPKPSFNQNPRKSSASAPDLGSPPPQGSSPQQHATYSRRKSTIPASADRNTPRLKKARSHASGSSSRLQETFRSLLEFGEEEELAKERYRKLSKLVITPEKFLFEQDLKDLGAFVAVQRMMVTGGFVDLYSLLEDICDELTLEVLCTFQVDWTHSHGHNVRFRLAREQRVLSFDEFGLATGCYYGTIEECPRIDPYSFKWQKNERNSFWSELCHHDNLVFKPSVSKASEMYEGIDRMVHKWLTKSICVRGEGDSALNDLELLCLYSMEKGHKIDLEKLMPMHFQNMAS